MGFFHLFKVELSWFLSSVQGCTELKHIETDIGLPALLDVHISPIKN